MSAARPGRGCPVCGRTAVREFRPFCSDRCARVDFGRWLKGAYAIAGDPLPDDDGDGSGGESEGA
jgi:hypothetical protein